MNKQPLEDIAASPSTRLGTLSWVGMEGIAVKRVDEQSQRPVLLHRALFGTLERFLGILIEHHAGKLPAWLAPQQAVVMSITEVQAGYAEALCGAGLRQAPGRGDGT